MARPYEAAVGARMNAPPTGPEVGPRGEIDRGSG